MFIWISLKIQQDERHCLSPLTLLFIFNLLWSQQLHTKAASSTFIRVSETIWCSGNVSAGTGLKLLHLPREPCAKMQLVCVASLRCRCDQPGAGVPSHPRLQHRHHCHCPAGSSGQPWEQTGRSLTSRTLTLKLQRNKGTISNVFSTNVPFTEGDGHGVWGTITESASVCFTHTKRNKALAANYL